MYDKLKFIEIEFSILHMLNSFFLLDVYRFHWILMSLLCFERISKQQQQTKMYCPNGILIKIFYCKGMEQNLCIHVKSSPLALLFIYIFCMYIIYYVLYISIHYSDIYYLLTSNCNSFSFFFFFHF